MSVIFRYFVILFSLFLAISIYLIFREKSSPFYIFTLDLGYSDIIDSVRNVLSSIHIPKWALYSLPDGLWMFSFVLLMMAVWNFDISGPGKIWIIISIIFGISFEILQGFVPSLGFFDWIDMIFITSGAALSLLFINKKNELYEKV